VVDQGAALLNAIVASCDGQSDADIRRVVSTIVDPLGTFYRFGLANSLLQGARLGATAGDACAAQTHQEEAR